MSDRVQYFLKRSSLASGKLDDMRTEASPIFFDYLQKKKLRDWNEAESVIWLSHIGMERYRAAFFHNHVTGKTLEKMTSDKLRLDVGVTSLGHRELILDEIGPPRTPHHSRPTREHGKATAPCSAAHSRGRRGRSRACSGVVSQTTSRRSTTSSSGT
jgi:hypothetical protein